MSLLKPNIKTPFHIDFEWWKQNERDWHVFLQSFLCEEHQQAFAEMEAGELIDWIDPETAEVKQVDGVQHALISHCALLPEFLSERTAIVESIFRTFLANGNIAMSAEDLSKRLGRPADTILKTISGVRVYRGLRPVQQTQTPSPAVVE
jgi:hypothetical protein